MKMIDLTLLLWSLSLILAPIAAKPYGYSRYYYPPRAVCTEYTIPITVSTDILPWNATRWPADDYALTDFVSSASTRLSVDLPQPFGSPVNFASDFEISATFCTPKNPSGHSKTILLASHGIGFNKDYWNMQIDPEEYNFAQYAINDGYSIFFYDRLGVGKSTRISGFVNQANIQINILSQLTSCIRSGKYIGTLGVPKFLILIGHSFGSFLSNGLIAVKPKAADAVVLTGMSYTGYDPLVILETFNPKVSSLQSPQKFGDRDAGYLTNVDVWANVNLFFKAPKYTPRVAMFSEATKMPFAITEMLSLNYLNLSAPAFTGPALILSGQYDFILCGGLCDDILQRGAKQALPASKNLSTVSYPGLGHGMNFHLGVQGAYQIALDFLAGNGF